ncbi:MAG: DUF371 domain-containing protein [Methanoregula sp.]|jgi:hypothetical protein|nr:DUF371 domain-containing protein [Methanoregula sp.]
MEAQETVYCRGHPLVLGNHPTTFEVTREDHLTKNGNCIIGIAADKGCSGLSPEFKQVLSQDNAVLFTRLLCGGVTAEVKSRGSVKFTLDHPTDIVWRRSSFVCGRTIGIWSDHVAATLPEALIANLVAGKEMTVIMTARRPG